MTRCISALIVLGLLSTGVEGAVDAVDVAHSGDAAGLHEEHHAHPGDPADPGSPEPESHAHTCHCGLHVPPLFAATQFVASNLRHVQQQIEHALNALGLGPPPLPPPIA